MASQAPTVAVVAWAAGQTNGVLVEAWRELGMRSLLLTPPEARSRLVPGDVAVVRLDVLQTLDGVEEGLGEMSSLSRLGVRIVNTPEALLAAHDKLETARRLDAAGVRHPRWTHVTTIDELRGQEMPYVVKPRFGSWGRDVYRCRTVRERERILDTISGRAWFRRQGALVQEVVPPLLYDLRLLVAGGKVMGAVERRAAPGEWRTNVSLGGSRVTAGVPERARALGLAAAEAIGADFVGVDLLPVGDGHTVVELNAAVDFDRLYSLPRHDVFADVAAALELAAPAEGQLAYAQTHGREPTLPRPRDHLTPGPRAEGLMPS